jgi:hypothetical protein
MPISEGPQLNLPRTIAFAAASLVIGVGLLLVIVWLAGSGDVQFKLGDDVFRAGSAEDRAETISRDGSPILFPSLSRSRPIYLQHLGDDPALGWFAIDARSPSDPAGCETGLSWDSADAVFVDTCEPDSTFPADGEGLLRYGVAVDADGGLRIDLNQD